MPIPCNSVDVKGHLWATKPPLVGESRASWIQRLCGDHQYSLAVLERVLGHQPRRSDWDLNLNSSAWLQTLQMAGLSADLAVGDMAVLNILAHCVKEKSFFLYTKGVPTYRWCGACFALDKTAYLRWYWRLSAVHECWIHRVPLNETCSLCQYPFTVNKARLTGRCAVSLAECPNCGMSLSVVQNVRVRSVRGEQRRLQDAFKYIWKKKGFKSNWDTAETVSRLAKVLPSTQLRTSSVPDWIENIWLQKKTSLSKSQASKIEAETPEISLDIRSNPVGDIDRGSEEFDAEPVTSKKDASSDADREKILLHALSMHGNGWILNGDCFNDPVASSVSPPVFPVPWEWTISAISRADVAEAIRKIHQEALIVESSQVECPSTEHPNSSIHNLGNQSGLTTAGEKSEFQPSRAGAELMKKLTRLHTGRAKYPDGLMSKQDVMALEKCSDLPDDAYLHEVSVHGNGWLLNGSSFHVPTVSEVNPPEFPVPRQWSLLAENRMDIAEAIRAIQKELSMNADKQEESEQ